MQVLKFGGAPLRNSDGFRQMAAILRDADQALVIVSALGTTTRELDRCCQSAANGDVEAASRLLKSIVDRHLTIAKEAIGSTPVVDDVTPGLHDVERELSRIFTSIAITKQCTSRTRDRVLAAGEKLSLTVVSAVLQSAEIDAISIEAKKVMVTTGLHGKAYPIESKTRVHVQRDLEPLFKSHKFVVTEGFVGSTEDGHITTMGNESSNLTATLLGSILGASMVTIYTDVEGIRSADPLVCSGTELRAGFSFSDAKRAAKHGLKLLYPTMIEPAESDGMPIRIASAANPLGELTTIASTAPPSRPIVTLHDGDDSTTRRVSVVFCTTTEWTTAAAKAAETINEFDTCYVSSDPSDGSVTFLCSKSCAPELAEFLHNYLVTNAKATQ